MEELLTAAQVALVVVATVERTQIQDLVVKVVALQQTADQAEVVLAITVQYLDLVDQVL